MPRLPYRDEEAAVDAVAVSNGDIFVTLSDGIGLLSAVWKYSQESGSWRTITLPLHFPCVAFEDKFVYAMGGKLTPKDGQATTQCARLDTVENKMEELAPMQIARYDAYGVAAHRKIFVLGRILGDQRTSLPNCELYNIDSNEWHFIADVVVRSTFSLSCMQCDETKLYLVERCSGPSLVCYDIKRDEWTRTAMPMEAYYSYKEETISENAISPSLDLLVANSACSVRIPKNTRLDNFRRLHQGLWLSVTKLKILFGSMVT